jgi:hypothetical protein
MSRAAALALPIALAALAASPAYAERLTVDPDAGNNTLSAVFDAPLGERITAMSSSVSCDVTYDEETGQVSGTCTVPLTSIRVDNEPTKTEHFRQWATNKKADPKACRFEARFEGVKLGKLLPEHFTPFTAEIPFTVCGRPRTDGKKEQVTGTAVLFASGRSAGHTLRIRAEVKEFDRTAYQIGPQYTDGWLGRVAALARVVAQEGTLELTLFATQGGLGATVP